MTYLPKKAIQDQLHTYKKVAGWTWNLNHGPFLCVYLYIYIYIWGCLEGYFSDCIYDKCSYAPKLVGLLYMLLQLIVSIDFTFLFFFFFCSACWFELFKLYISTKFFRLHIKTKTVCFGGLLLYHRIYIRWKETTYSCKGRTEPTIHI